MSASKADLTIGTCPLSWSLSGVKQTSLVAPHMFAFDPKRTCAKAREDVIARMLDAVACIGFIVRTHVPTEVRMPRLILQSTITCPNCGSIKTETMPTNACQFFYNCSDCGVRLKPKAGDCCVFCSYGDVLCPPVQEAREKYERSACCAT
jgi:hypothetical protein